MATGISSPRGLSCIGRHPDTCSDPGFLAFTMLTIDAGPNRTHQDLEHSGWQDFTHTTPLGLFFFNLGFHTHSFAMLLWFLGCILRNQMKTSFPSCALEIAGDAT